MSGFRWLDVRDIRMMHSRMIAEFGGSDGVRDDGLLESAVARPQNLAAYGEPSLAQLAASLAYGIARNHAFVDGNKRVAFAIMVIFLRLNGFALRTTADDAEAFLIDEVIQARTPLPQIATWIEEHIEETEMSS